MFKKIFGLLLIAIVASLAGLPAQASSHREAPAITRSPQVDGTDFYLFRSYEPGREGFVTLIADYNPLQDPYGGPNYFALDPDAVYDIHIDNDGDAIEDLTFRFRMNVQNVGIAIPVGNETVPVPLVNVGQIGGPPFGVGALNQRRFYTVRLIRGAVDDPASTEVVGINTRTGQPHFAPPFDNIGTKSIPDYQAYAQQRIYPINFPGCGEGKVFVGQRKEPFQVNLGEVFDLVNLNPVGPPDGRPSVTADKNITALALEIPIDCLTDDSPVIGGWTTASLPRERSLTEKPTFDDPDFSSGDLVQVSRLGNPLVNEVVIGIGDKNLFNASQPKDDGQFLHYVSNPVLPELLQVLFGVQAPNNFPRNDLILTFLTGIPGLNDTATPSEMLRLNTAVDVTPKAQQDFLGVPGGDAAGFPNGRRPGDDVVDIALRAVMGALCHLGVGCEPADAPDGLLPYTDQAFQDASQFDNAFPYLTTPLPGANP
jgi:hypothetical protein